MKITCEIVKDLLPLYHDDICSKDSRIVVEEHLQECATCKKYLESMDSDFIPTDIEKVTEQSKVETLKGLKKKLFRKNMLISLVSVLCAVGVCFGIFSLIFHYQMPILYEDGLVSIEMKSDVDIDAIFNGDDYYCSYTIQRIIEKDGIEKCVAYIYYTDTIWTKYFSKKHNQHEYRHTINPVELVGCDENGKDIISRKEIIAVYYLPNITHINWEPGEVGEETKDAILLWEK